MRIRFGLILTAAAMSVGVVKSEDFARWVDPFVGTVGNGNCFPGPCRPFGMVQPSPDTGSKVTCSGYKFTDTTIRGFSQTHLNGTGRPAMGDISILPFFSTGLTGLTGLSGDAPPDFRNPVNLVNPVKKETEVAEIGYYAVTLENGVKCEATATERVAVWRFTWPEGTERRIYVDAAAMLMQAWNAKLGATVPESSAFLREDRRGMTGYKKALGWTPYKLFYAFEFSEPWAKIEKLPSDPFQGKGDRWMIDFNAEAQSGRVAQNSQNLNVANVKILPIANANSKWEKGNGELETVSIGTGNTSTMATVETSLRSSAALRLCVKNSLEVRIALSTVSEEGASENMKAESEGRSFDEIRSGCRAAWNEIFSRAQLVKGTDDQKKNWYTALYHLCIQPNIQTDVNGRYRGADDAIHTARRGHYSTFSLWDTFRAAHPLYTIIVPERVPGFVDSLVAFGREHGHLPMWTMWNGEDHCMVGIHSIPVIVDAWKKGLLEVGENSSSSRVESFDSPTLTQDSNCILTLMVQSMVNNDGENPKNCWNAYWENGYIPYFAGEFDEHLPRGQSVSTTLELAYNWWCIADYARIIGDQKTEKEARKWADCWKNVFDKESGFVRPRAPKTSGGGWREPFDPMNPRVGGNFWSDFTEANAWIYTWHVFQDVDALADALGGREKALAKLDEFFATMPKGRKGNSDEGGLTADGNLRRGQIGQYWHGNEPSHHIAYLYSIWGRREKTAEIVGRICREAYLPRPEGLCGNDDCGQMSAWYLFSMMGFYPVNPCGDGYVLGAAQAEEIKLREGKGEFRIVRSGDGEGVMFNGKVVNGFKISHEEIMRGGVLSFE